MFGAPSFQDSERTFTSAEIDDIKYGSSIDFMGIKQNKMHFLCFLPVLDITLDKLTIQVEPHHCPFH